MTDNYCIDHEHLILCLNCVSHLRGEKEEKLRYKNKANQYEVKLKDARKGLASRDDLILTLEGTQDELKAQVGALEVRTDSSLL